MTRYLRPYMVPSYIQLPNSTVYSRYDPTQYQITIPPPSILVPHIRKHIRKLMGARIHISVPGYSRLYIRQHYASYIISHRRYLVYRIWLYSELDLYGINPYTMRTLIPSAQTSKDIYTYRQEYDMTRYIRPYMVPPYIQLPNSSVYFRYDPTQPQIPIAPQNARLRTISI